MKNIPDLFYEMNGGLQALAGSKAGAGAIAATI
jgi:hypothetical protein